MKKLLFPFLFAMILLAGAFWGFRTARGQANGGQEIIHSESQDANTRQIVAPAGIAVPDQPLIGFIDSPTVVCYQPDPTQDVCKINWYYMAVDANPNYMISMTVAIAPYGQVARMGGFFQTSMYVPYNMLGEGFRVACGAVTNPTFPYNGNSYSWTIRARDSSGLGSANYGSVTCPAYQP